MKNIIKIIYKSILLFLFALVLQFFFYDDINSYTRIMMHEMQDSEENIDLLFVGASHVYRGIDAKKADLLTGKNTFNAGSSSQQMLGSYYLLRQAAKNNELEAVFLDVTYIMADYYEEGEGQTYIIADYMDDLFLKFEYLYQARGIKEIPHGFFPMFHFTDDPFKITKAHLSDEYRNCGYEFVTYPNEEYRGKGFVYSFDKLDENYVFQNTVSINPDHPMSEYTRNHLDKIIQFCEANSIRLILIDVPMPDGTLISSEYYQEFIDYVSEAAKQNGIEYWNFNLCKSDILNLSYSDYKDDCHLNGDGAEKFTTALCKVYLKEARFPFYETYAEKIKLDYDGTIFENSDAECVIRKECVN